MFIVKTEYLLLVSKSVVDNPELISETSFLLAWTGGEPTSIMRLDGNCNLLAIRNGIITKIKDAVIIQAFNPRAYDELQTYGGLIAEAIKTYYQCEGINIVYNPDTYSVKFLMQGLEEIL